MLGNYIKIALRGMWKHKSLSVINIAGLAIGMCCCILIFRWVQFETGYDRYHPDHERIFRIASDGRSDAEEFIAATTSAPLAPRLIELYPQVEYAARVLQLGRGLIKNGETSFYEEGRMVADGGFFDVFGVTLLRGDARTALTRPRTVVITRKIAETYYGAADPVGKTLLINGVECEVTGIIATPPPQTHLKYSMLISLESIAEQYPLEEWFLRDIYTYVTLHPGVDAAAFAEQLRQSARHIIGPRLDDIEGTYEFVLQPVADIHLHSHLRGEAEAPGSALFVYAFSIIGILILLIAGINYINLTTSRSILRAREVGVRKSIGAGYGQLMRQFLSESTLTSLVSLIIACALAEVLLAPLNELSGSAVGGIGLGSPSSILLLIGMGLAVGIGAGIYPAMILTGYRPSAILKGASNGGLRGGRLRRLLVVIQMAVSVILIAGAIVVFRQLDYMTDSHPGFDSEQKLVVPVRTRTFSTAYAGVKSEFVSLPGVTGATASSEVPGGDGISCWGTWLRGRSERESRNIYYLATDEEFVAQYGLRVLSGRNFSAEDVADSTRRILLNEQAVRALGFTANDDAVGAQVDLGFVQGRIVGVVGDFHYSGLQEPLEPMALWTRTSGFRKLTLTVTRDDLAATLDGVKAIWQRLYPEIPFEYGFLDDSFERQYNAEAKQSIMMTVFGILGTIIASLGLFGLMSFAAQRRTKELGIRKVLGASVSELVRLLVREFFFITIIANLLAWPVVYLLGSRWLETFAYRVQMDWTVFLMITGISLLVTLVTVSYQAFHAALANPVEALKYE